MQKNKPAGMSIMDQVVWVVQGPDGVYLVTGSESRANEYIQGLERKFPELKNVLILESFTLGVPEIAVYGC